MNRFQLIMQILGIVSPMLADSKITLGEISEAITVFLKANGYWDKTVYEVK